MGSQSESDQSLSSALTFLKTVFRTAWPISSEFYLAGIRPAWEAAFPTDVVHERGYL